MTPRAPHPAGGGDAGRRPLRRLVRRDTAPVPSSVSRFRERIRQRRLTRVRPWLAAGTVLVLLAAVAWIVYGSPLFGVRAVRVAGNALVNADQVRAAAAIAPGTPLAGLDGRKVGARVVAGLPPVRTATVDREWPGTVVITVSERVAVAAVAQPEKQWLLLDAVAVGFLRVGAPPEKLPVLVVSEPGPKDPATVAALSVLAALTPQLRERLVLVEAPAPTRITLKLAGGRSVVWGDASKNRDKARVATGLLGYRGSVIDVSAPDAVALN
jgi:cell division protein FtsQ